MLLQALACPVVDDGLCVITSAPGTAAQTGVPTARVVPQGGLAWGALFLGSPKGHLSAPAGSDAPGVAMGLPSSGPGCPAATWPGSWSSRFLYSFCGLRKALRDAVGGLLIKALPQAFSCPAF